MSIVTLRLRVVKVHTVFVYLALLSDPNPVLLPPVYVVQREGNSFTLFVSPHLGGGSGPAVGGVRSS